MIGVAFKACNTNELFMRSKTQNKDLIFFFSALLSSLSKIYARD